MASKLQLYNAALRLVGERSLASLTEDREPRRVLDEVYNDAVLYCLEQGFWDRALRTIKAESVPSVEPTFGYLYAFTIPDDWLRTDMQSSQPNFEPPLTDIVAEQGYWYANFDPIYIRYVSSDLQYGRDNGKWLMAFQKYLEAHLAAEICTRLTQGKTDYESLRKLEEKYKREAKSIDAMNGPARFPPEGRWARSKRGFGTSRFNGSTRGL